MLTYFNNLRIKNKMLVGFGAILTLLTIVTLVSYLTITSASSGFTTYRNWAEVTNTLGRLQSNLLDARLGVRNFIQNGDQKYADDFKTRYEKVHLFIDQAIQEIADEGRQRKIKTIDTESAEYETKFNELVEFVKKKNSQIKTVLEPVGLRIVNDRLNPLVASGNSNAIKAAEKMLYARLFAMKYLERNTDANADRVREVFKELDAYVARINNSSLRNDTKSYQDGFELIVKYSDEINGILKDLDNIGPRIASNAEELKLEFQNDQERLGNEVNNANSTGVTWILIAGLLALLSGVGAGLIIANAISKPILTVVDRIEQLQSACLTQLGDGLVKMAEGDLSAKVAKSTKHLNFNQTDEIGQMANSVDQIITKTQIGIDSYEIVRDKIRSLSNEAVTLISSAKEGKLDNRGNASKFNGAYREIISGFNDVLNEIILPLQDGSRVLAIMATGDLTPRITKEYKGDHRKITDSINQLGDSLENVLTQINEAVAATASAATQISSSSEEMAAGAQEQSAQSSEVAQAVEEMAKTILDTTNYATNAAENSDKAGKIAKDGGDVMLQTISGMNKIAEVVSEAAGTVEALGANSDKIGEIIQVINDIADQTNLLALNAAIEAARAGEQGRGFAVVADEVRKLAERTTKATKEIAGMIKAIQNDTNEAVTSINRGNQEVVTGKDLVAKAGKSLEEIINSSNNVLSSITQVAAASEEQSTAAEQISKNIESINAVTQESAAGVQQIARAAEDLNSLTNNLENLVAQFKLRTHGAGGNSSKYSGRALNANAEFVNY